MEFYEYDFGDEKLKEAQDDGVIDMSGIKMKAVSNNNIVMVNHNDHFETDALVEAFDKYKKKKAWIPRPS